MDACCFLEMMKEAIGLKVATGRSREISYCKMLLESHRDGVLECWTSTITIAECLHVNGKISEDAKRLLQSLLTSGQFLYLISADPFIAEVDAMVGDVWEKPVCVRCHQEGELCAGCGLCHDCGAGLDHIFPTVGEPPCATGLGS